ncbi:hypothetical protein CspeluHIS016_0212100 [Cutaneotrichosporon spelunceum]|uniref:Beta-glucuronidase C-terminal domain-containing protein n=1 Tax=Cutaneotrichosporon spelunceum TaxID=1672016 RepID=A0AAD3YBU2_9TREE|nr:hypothetical protein CspeluHIS016_0212100 [Cutaneotrichosporon spelunceum]
MRIPVDALLVSRAVNITGNVTDSTLLLPASQPPFAEKLDPQIGAFSIEMDHWRDWAGNVTGQPNTFVNTALGHLSERTGQPVYFRVGANSEDRATLDLSVEIMQAEFPAPTPDVPAPEADHIAIGRDFYALSGNLPEGTFFHWGVNLKVLNDTETEAQLRHLADTFQGSGKDKTKNVKLKLIEIGNEPDFYQGIGTVKAGWEEWNAANYTVTWARLAKAATKIFKFDQDTKLAPGAYANFSPQYGSLSWTPIVSYENNVFVDKTVRKDTGQWSMHMYSGAFSADIPVHVGTLMDKSNIRSNMSTKASDIKATRAQGLTYVLAETNSYANHGVPGLSNGGEQVMWAVDTMLHGATMGIARQHFHNGRGFKYNVLQPIALDGTGVDDGVGRGDRPHVMPLYYAILIVNEAVGMTGNSYVAEIPTFTNSLSAYAIWENGKLVRAVVVNTDVYTADSPARSGIKLALSNLGTTSVTVKRFHTPYTNATNGFTWAGQSFDTETSDPEGELAEELVAGSVEIEASSVVLLSFK